MMGPLSGLTVVSLEQAIAAPFATRQLADLGARVIKIERPDGGDFARDYDGRVTGQSSHFVWVNRSKESLTLDIKHPRSKEVMERLLSEADILVQNLAPGATKRLGLDFDTLNKHYKKLIVCDISGYGSDGTYAQKKAYDLLLQAESGFLSVTGTETEMAKAGCSIADIAAGMYAYSNILAALIQRSQTGKGCRIDVSMLEAMAEWMSFPMYYAYDGAAPPPRAGASHATIYPYGPFKGGDGKTLILGLQNDREWQRFCEIVLENPTLASDERFSTNTRRSANRGELQKIIEEAFAEADCVTLAGRLDSAAIANARVNDMHGLWAHPQLLARNRWREVMSPAGLVPALLPPGGIDGFERMDAVPRLGQHTKSILLELGFDADFIYALER
jgi:itaconate CoA-transferase